MLHLRFFCFSFLYPSGTSRGLLSSDRTTEYDFKIEQKKISTAVSCDVEAQWQTLPLVWCNSERRQTPMWLREANTDIVYDVQYNSQRPELPSCVKLRLIQRPTLSYCTLRGKLCHLVWCSVWNRETNTVVLCYVEYDREANCDRSDDGWDAQV